MTLSRRLNFSANLAKQTVSHYLENDQFYSKFKLRKYTVETYTNSFLKGWYVWYLLQEFLLLHTHTQHFTIFLT